MAQTPDKPTILATLAAVADPASGRDIVSAGLVRDVSACDGVVRVVLQLAPGAAPAAAAHIRDQATATVGRLVGVRQVHVELAPSASVPGLPGVRHVIAVGAGKGGVGKSTVALLIAYGLHRRGKRTGLLDADVYGPSIPKMTGTEAEQPAALPDGRIDPPQVDGMKVMSMGHVVSADQAIVWRGPMAQKYVKEFLERGAWGELDYLVVDLPPGTGDIPLTLAQSIPLSGAVVVCTPQDVALLDAIRALRMYQKLGVQPLGIVENMSGYVCPHCGERDDVFGRGGAEQAARELGVPFLGAIPLNAAICVHGDAGRPEAYFQKTERTVIDAVERFLDRVVEEVERSAAAAGPLPTVKIT